MHPGTLIADIGHLEEVFIKPHLANRLPEKRLMGARRTGSHDHAVEIMLINSRFDLFLGILRAGVEVFIHIYDLGKRPGIFLHLRDIDDSSYVNPAVAYEDTDPR